MLLNPLVSIAINNFLSSFIKLFSIELFVVSESFKQNFIYSLNGKSIKIAKCLCGGIKMKVKGKLADVINCHCSQCRKTNGNYGAYTNCPEENVTFISKKTLKWYRSSTFAKRGFCSRCGTSMFYKLLKSEELDIAAGMLVYFNIVLFTNLYKA